MKKILLAATALMVAAATIASAGTPRGSLALGWDNCRINGGGVSNKTFACNTNTGSGPLLVASCVPSATANLTSLNGGFMYVDVFADAGIDPWWQFTDPPVT